MKIVALRYDHSADSLTPSGRMEGAGTLQFAIEGVAPGQEAETIRRLKAGLQNLVYNIEVKP